MEGDEAVAGGEGAAVAAAPSSGSQHEGTAKGWRRALRKLRLRRRCGCLFGLVKMRLFCVCVDCFVDVVVVATPLRSVLFLGQGRKPVQGVPCTRYSVKHDFIAVRARPRQYSLNTPNFSSAVRTAYASNGNSTATRFSGFVVLSSDLFQCCCTTKHLCSTNSE